MSKWQGKKARKAIVLYSNSQSYFEGEDCKIQRNRRQGISNGLKWNKSKFFISVLLNEIRIWGKCKREEKNPIHGLGH